MQIINIHKAKTHLSRLVEEAAKGNAFIIAKAGKPMVKVSPLAAEENPLVKRLGFMAGKISVPDDFDTMETSTLPGFLKVMGHEIIARYTYPSVGSRTTEKAF